ncbi:MAG: hypothetical protein J7K35_08165 [Syntrophobacterales bacterium]|nr:hypothetical protein [Syntrophobacterales bacterium]
MNLVEKIDLPNNLVLQVWDKSRAIASDTTKIELRIVIDVEVKEEYFSDPEHFKQVVTVFGQEISYEYAKERTFVSASDSKRVFDELLDDFMRNSFPYISRTDFPARFAISKLRDIRQHPYRYRDILGETGL